MLICLEGKMAIFIWRTLTKSVLSQKSIIQFSARSDYTTETTFKTAPYKLHMLTESPSEQPTITREIAFKLYKDMYTIRKMETQAGAMYRAKLVRGFLHLYSGEEAVAVGMKSLLDDHDKIITAYRCHGWAYLQSHSEVRILAELAGRVNGLSHGKGGSMHLYTNKLFGGNGIVGAQVSLGTGIALAEKLKNKNNVCITLYGDGAANQGQVFESFNTAKLLNLPCVYVCENNKYGMGTSDERSSANPVYYKRCEYIPGIQADGMDVIAMREVTKYALDYCKKGKGPIIIEAITYRYAGHSMSDPGVSYRSREEVKKIREEKDPIRTFRKKITESKLVTEDEIKRIGKEIKSKVEKAAQAAISADSPPPEDLAADVYAKPLTKTYRNVVMWEPLNAKSSHRRMYKD